MSNVIYRMPYFFQTMLSINLNNYRKHWQYLMMLMSGLSQKVGGRSVVIAGILQKDDFVRWQLVKMVALCLRMLDAMPDPICLLFL